MGRLFKGGGGLLYIIVLAIFVLIMFRVLSAGSPDVKELDSQQFQKAIDENAFKLDVPADEQGTLTVMDKDQTVTGLLKDGNKEFEFAYPERYDIAAAFNKADVAFETDPQNQGFWTSALLTIGPIFLLILVFLFFMSTMQGGGNRVMSFGKSKAKRMTKDSPQVTFEDVAGVDEAVQELTEIKEFLESPQKFQKLGARIP
ncbi:MAG: ATP-dependent zinc metalloprotease FtsH, partial [Rubrobacteraceae bacterium]